MNYLVIVFLFFLINLHICNAKVLIMSAAYNRPDLIEIQHRCFKKFVIEEFEQVIFNDAEDPRFEKEINEECTRLGIRCIRVPQDIVHENKQKNVIGWEDFFNFRSKDGNERYVFRVNIREGEVIQYMFEQVGFQHNDIVVSIDLDCFPLRRVSFREILNGQPMAGILWWMPPYLASYTMPIFMVFDMPKLPHKKALNFNSGFIGSNWYDLCALLQFYIYCHDITPRDYGSLGHVHCWKIARDKSEKELLNVGYDNTVIDFVKKYYKTLFLELGYFPLGEAGKDYTAEFQSGKTGIHDQGQIIERYFFHFNGCTNWGGLYDDTFMKAKTRFVRDFVFALP